MNYLNRAEDCKSPIVGSIPTRASITNYGGNCNILGRENRIQITPFVHVSYTLKNTSSNRGLWLEFAYNGQTIKVRLNLSLSELTEEYLRDYISSRIREIDGVITIQELLDWVLNNEECGGNSDTRRKIVSHMRDLAKRDGFDLNQGTVALLNVDELGRTLPERWQALYNLPHKIRQIRSIFSRKNLVLFKREGWDTGHFGNWATYVAQSPVSQPFTTTDEEVQRTISFFTERKDSHPVFYDIYLLAFGAGLRKSEIYQVEKKDFTTFNGQHFLLLPFDTKRSRLKGTNHLEKVGVSTQLYNHFTSSDRPEGKVICGGGERLHKRFVKFLKEELGIQENKACHRLRKILGARLATEHGIYHSAKTLRNSVGVAERYYSDLISHKNELVL